MVEQQCIPDTDGYRWCLGQDPGQPYTPLWKVCVPAGTPCKFPFIYQGVEYNSCIREDGLTWCAVDTFEDGTMRLGHWRTCDCEENQALPTEIRYNPASSTKQYEHENTAASISTTEAGLAPATLAKITLTAATTQEAVMSTTTRTLPAADTVGSSRGCASWCSTITNLWLIKCSYQACNECTECASIEREAPVKISRTTSTTIRAGPPDTVPGLLAKRPGSTKRPDLPSRPKDVEIVSGETSSETSSDEDRTAGRRSARTTTSSRIALTVCASCGVHTQTQVPMLGITMVHVFAETTNS